MIRVRKGEFAISMWRSGRGRRVAETVAGKVCDVYGAHRTGEGRDAWWTITHLPTGGVLLRPDTGAGADRALRLLAELAPGAGANWPLHEHPPADDPDFERLRDVTGVLAQRVDARRQDWPHMRDAIRLALAPASCEGQGAGQ